MARTDELRLICPKCEKQDGQKKLYFNMKKKIGHCHRCKDSFSVVDLISIFGWDIIVDPKTLESRVREKLYRTPGELPSKNDKEHPYFNILSLYYRRDVSTNALMYIYSRGLTDGDIQKYKIFYCSDGYFKDRFVIPIADNFYCGRLLPEYESEDRPKYLYSPAERAGYLFPEDNITPGTLLVEGAIDAIRSGGVAILGSYISNLQIKILFKKNVKSIYLALDAETWKDGKMYTNVRNLMNSKKFAVNQIRPIKLKDKDPAELGFMDMWDMIHKQDNGKNILSLLKSGSTPLKGSRDAQIQG